MIATTPFVGEPQEMRGQGSMFPAWCSSEMSLCSWHAGPVADGLVSKGWSLTSVRKLCQVCHSPHCVSILPEGLQCTTDISNTRAILIAGHCLCRAAGMHAGMCSFDTRPNGCDDSHDIASCRYPLRCTECIHR